MAHFGYHSIRIYAIFNVAQAAAVKRVAGPHGMVTAQMSFASASTLKKVGQWLELPIAHEIHRATGALS